MPAAAKPSGTRMRRAILLQLGSGVLQQTARCGDHFIGCDFEQANIRFAGVRERSLAGRVPQHNIFRSVWTVAGGIGWSEDRQHWNL